MDDTQISTLFYSPKTVSSIRLYTHIALGDLLVAFQKSGEYSVAIQNTTPDASLNADLYYLGDGYILNTVVNCHQFWSQPTQLILGDHPSFIDRQAQVISLNSAKHQIAVTCRRYHET